MNNWLMVKLIGGIYVLYEAYLLIKSVVEKDPEGFDPPIAIAMSVVLILIGGGFLLSSLKDYKNLKKSEKEAAEEAKKEEEAKAALEAEYIEVVEEDAEDILEADSEGTSADDPEAADE